MVRFMPAGFGIPCLAILDQAQLRCPCLAAVVNHPSSLRGAFVVLLTSFSNIAFRGSRLPFTYSSLRFLVSWKVVCISIRTCRLLLLRGVFNTGVLFSCCGVTFLCLVSSVSGFASSCSSCIRARFWAVWPFHVVLQAFAAYDHSG